MPKSLIFRKSFPHLWIQENSQFLVCFWFPLHFYPPTCRWHLVSRDRSLSRLLALSFWGLLGWRSFSDVLLPRLPANFGSCLKAKRAKEERDKLNNSLHSDMNNHTCAFTVLYMYIYLLDEMIRDSVLVILPLGGSLSKNVSMLSISSSVVGVTASGCSWGETKAEKNWNSVYELRAGRCVSAFLLVNSFSHLKCLKDRLWITGFIGSLTENAGDLL